LPALYRALTDQPLPNSPVRWAERSSPGRAEAVACEAAVKRPTAVKRPAAVKGSSRPTAVKGSGATEAVTRNREAVTREAAIERRATIKRPPKPVEAAATKTRVAP
jgi:hypothetical protein